MPSGDPARQTSEPRRDLPVPLAVEVVGRDGRRRAEYALNVSASGLALHVEQLLPVGEPLLLAFALPDGGGRLEVRGRIAWHEAVARTERPRFREVGVRFEGLREQELRRLARFALPGAG